MKLKAFTTITAFLLIPQLVLSVPIGQLIKQVAKNAPSSSVSQTPQFLSRSGDSDIKSVIRTFEKSSYSSENIDTVGDLIKTLNSIKLDDAAEKELILARKETVRLLGKLSSLSTGESILLGKNLRALSKKCSISCSIPLTKIPDFTPKNVQSYIARNGGAYRFAVDELIQRATGRTTYVARDVNIELKRLGLSQEIQGFALLFASTKKIFGVSKEQRAFAKAYIEAVQVGAESNNNLFMRDPASRSFLHRVLLDEDFMTARDVNQQFEQLTKALKKTTKLRKADKNLGLDQAFFQATKSDSKAQKNLRKCYF